MRFSSCIPAILSVALISSCGGRNDKEHDAPEFYDLSNPERVKVSDVLEVAEMVPLLFERDTYPKRSTFVSFLDSDIVIEEDQDMIHVFSNDGHYIGCSKSKFGEGPGEYTLLIGHVVNPFTNTIDIMTAYKMISYDAEFTRCERDKRLPTIVGTEGNILYDDGSVSPSVSETSSLKPADLR